MQTRQLDKHIPVWKGAKIILKGSWPGASRVVKLARERPVVVRGFAENMTLFQQIENDANLVKLQNNDKLMVKKTVHESKDKDSLPLFDHSTKVPRTLNQFLEVYQNHGKPQVYKLVAHGENYDVAKVDSDRSSYEAEDGDPFGGKMRSILPRIAQDHSSAAMKDDETLDPGGHFLAISTAMRESGLECHNVALFISGRTVTTGLHFGKRKGAFILCLLAPPSARARSQLSAMIPISFSSGVSDFHTIEP